jgi:hypothetical protein
MNQSAILRRDTDEGDKILYVTAYLAWNMRNQCWDSKFEYFKASCQGEARIKFTAANSNALIQGRMKLVDIGPVFGYYAEEDRNRNVIYSV